MVDFLVVMSYDEQSQMKTEECIARANSPLNKTMNGKVRQYVFTIKFDILVVFMSEMKLVCQDEEGRKTMRNANQRKEELGEFLALKSSFRRSCSLKGIPIGLLSESIDSKRRSNLLRWLIYLIDLVVDNLLQRRYPIESPS